MNEDKLFDKIIHDLRGRRFPSRKKKELRKRVKKERVYRIKSNHPSRRSKQDKD